MILIVGSLIVVGIGTYIYELRKPIVLEFGMFAQSNWDVANANGYAIVDRAIQKFETQHSNVEIHYESGIRKDDYAEWLAKKTLKGETPDVFMILSDDFYKYSSMGVLNSLDELIEQDKHFKKEYYYQSTLDTGTYQNQQYALPYETVPMLMFVNKTLLETEGFCVPEADWTWSDLEEISRAITKDTNNDGTMDQFGTYNYSWKEAAYSNNAKLFDEDGKNAYFTDSKVIESIQFAKHLNDLNQGKKVTQDDFDGGNVAFMPLSFSDYRTYKAYPYKIKKFTSFKWDCITMPSGSNGTNKSEVNTLSLGMSKRSKHQELAWEFMKTLTYDSEIQRMIYQYSQGASVLKYVTDSKYAESALRKDMEVSEKVIDSQLLSDVIEHGMITPTFSKYKEALSLAESQVTKIYEEEKNIDSSMKILQRDIKHFLKQ